MGTFDDILDSKSPEEKCRETQAKLDDAIREIKELQDELYNKDKRSTRAHELLQESKRYIEILKRGLSDEEIADADAEFEKKEEETDVTT